MSLTWNGEVISRGCTGDSMGHPLEGLAWVANFLAQNGRKLSKGSVVITGSALKTEFPQPGDSITYAIDGLGETSVFIRP